MLGVCSYAQATTTLPSWGGISGNTAQFSSGSTADRRIISNLRPFDWWSLFPCDISQNIAISSYSRINCWHTLCTRQRPLFLSEATVSWFGLIGLYFGLDLELVSFVSHTAAVRGGGPQTFSRKSGKLSSFTKPHPLPRFVEVRPRKYYLDSSPPRIYMTYYMLCRYVVNLIHI